MSEARRDYLPVAVALFAAAVLTADLLSPLHGVAWVLYIPVILAPVWRTRAWQVIIVSAVCSVLVLVGMFVPHPHDELWRSARNRGMGIVALWLTAAAGIIICRRSTRLTEVMANLESEMARRRELEREMLEVVSREQQRIGQELHDGVGQELTGLGLMANALTQRLADGATEKQIADRLLTGLDRVHQEVRSLSRGLIPVQVEAQGLCAALEDLAARASEESGIPVTFDCRNGAGVSVHTTATELYRIAQEAVSNALRHGRPQHVRLSLDSSPAELRLNIEDDGIGLGDATRNGKGMGLRIMQFRAEEIGGTLTVGPGKGGGTMVSCRLPDTGGNPDGRT